METPTWLSQLLLTKTVTDVCINAGQGVFVDQGEGLKAVPLDQESIRWCNHSLQNWAVEQLSLCGKTWDAKYPFADGQLKTGHRFHFAFPPISRNGILISIRRSPGKQTELQDSPTYKDRWENSHEFFEMLAEFVNQEKSILVSGATGSGKTTLTNDLLAFVPKFQRVLILEDTPELDPNHPHCHSLYARNPSADGIGGVSIRALLKETLRMRPDRIILGECRGPEVMELLQALNTGHRGSIATIHANSCRDALKRIELLCLLAFEGRMDPMVIREFIVQGLQVVAQVKRLGKDRKIIEVCQVEGLERGTFILRPLLPVKPTIHNSLSALRKNPWFTPQNQCENQKPE